MSPEDAADLKAQGWSDEEIANAIPVGNNTSQQVGNNAPTKSQTVLDTLKAHAGGTLGGGAGAIGAGLLAPWLLGPEVGLPADILIGAGGALAGGAGGSKLQQLIQGDAAYQQAQEQAARDAVSNPITAKVTDIASSALASGGLPSTAGIRSLLAGRIDNAAKSALLQAAINPAIESGVSLVSGNGIPSLGDLGESALGGALFSKSWLGGVGRPVIDEPTVNEPSQNEGQPPVETTATTAKQLEENPDTLNHGDEVHATMPDGTDVQGHVVDVNPKNNNPIIITKDKQYYELPEYEPLTEDEKTQVQKQLQEELGQEKEENNANSIQSSVGILRNESPGTTTQVAEGSTSGVQEPTGVSKAKEEKLPVLPTKEEIKNLTDKQLQEGYEKYQNDSRQSLANGNLQRGVEEATNGQWHREEMERRQNQVNPETNVPLGKFGKFWQNAIDRAREVSPEVADAYHRFLNEKQEIYGDVYGRVKNVMEKTGFTKEDGERLMQAARDEEKNKREVPLSFFRNNAQRAVWSEYKKVYKEQGQGRIADKQPVIDARNGSPRLMRPSDFSHPLMINPKIVDILRANTNTLEVEKLKNDFLSDQKSRGVADDKAQKNLDTILRAIQGRPVSHQGTGNLNYFNANRRAMGIPLPDKWTRQDFEQNLQAFAARNAADRAHFRNIEKNSSVMRQLGETHNAWGQELPPSDRPIVAGNPHVKALIESSHGEKSDTFSHIERSTSAALTSMLISSPALSGVHIPIANTVASVGMAENPILAGKMVLAGIKGISKGIITARKNGILHLNAKSASDMWNADLNAAERIQALAATIRKISTLNDLVTKGTVGYTQASMERLVPSKITRANIGGDKSAQQFLRNVDPDYFIGKHYNQEEIGKLASRLVSTIHGSSDARTMPTWMLHDNEISGFLSLAHWSVGQTDRFMKHIYTPATKGDYRPLLMSLFGSVVGGIAIKNLRELISGKKSQLPSLTEIAAGEKGLEGNVPLVAYNMIAAMQYSGFAGMFSQIAKYPFDAIYKNNPQGATFPLDEIAGDVVGTIHNATIAMANDPNVNYVDLVSAIGQHLAINDFRLGREAYYQAIDHGWIDGLPAEKKELSDKLGQLRRFEMVEDLPYQQIDDASNPYMNLEQKKFKMTPDLGEAAAQLPQMIENIFQTYSDKPDVLLQKLKALKTNQYQTFPSLEDAPLSFGKYLAYLSRQEGSDAAQKELMEYLKMKALNSAKASMVP